MRLLLDTNLLLKLCHPIKHPHVEKWLENWVAYGEGGGEIEVFIPSPSDYELRRGYLYALGKSPNRLDSRVALARLNALEDAFQTVFVTETVWHRASQLWADARLGGFQTAPDQAVDWDVIIASQAIEWGAVVVTCNARHFTCYGVDARNWDAIPAPDR